LTVLILMNDFNFDCPKYWINLDDLQDISETDMSWFDSQHPLHERIQVIYYTFDDDATGDDESHRNEWLWLS
jgi:hypothetical protein